MFTNDKSSTQELIIHCFANLAVVFRLAATFALAFAFALARFALSGSIFVRLAFARLALSPLASALANGGELAVTAAAPQSAVPPGGPACALPVLPPRAAPYGLCRASVDLSGGAQ